jgi:hypothetical protein
MIKKILTAIALSIFLAVTVLADQAAYITKAQADKAAAFLKDKKQIRHYCSPCDDKGDKVEDVKKIEAVKVDYQDFWEVQVNGAGIDLAYVYFQNKDGKWKNLAKDLGIKVKDVPKYLP